jgi:GNAT superfamily N-acetyltransferase
MTSDAPRYETSRVEEADAKSGFRCGKHPLDDYFKRHAVPNDVANIGRTYVLRRGPTDDAGLPFVLGFYTLSMAGVPSGQLTPVVEGRLPRYDMPVALIGRLAIDERAQRHGLGEKLLMDALRRVLDGAGTLGCVGVIVDAKDEGAERFYLAYGFVTILADEWPRRMFLALATVREALEG